MRTFTITELKQLLEKQRIICASTYTREYMATTEHHNHDLQIRNAPEPEISTEQEERAWRATHLIQKYSELIKFMNKLNEAGVTPDNIKLSSSSFGDQVLYFHTEKMYVIE